MSGKKEKKKIEKIAWGGNLEKKDKRKATHERLVRVDMMIGVAMILVVLGHFSIGSEPAWYHTLHNWIYSFHMQMFLFLSAFLVRYTYKPVGDAAGYFKYIWRKFVKFFLPFFLVDIAVALLACVFKNAEFSWPYVGRSIKTLLLYPRWSEASFLWYIYILFGYYLVSPLFFRLPQWVRVLCCVGAMFLPMLDAGQTLAAYDFSRYTFFYCLGVLCAEWIEEIRSVKPWMWGLLSVPFLAYTYWVFAESGAIGFEHTQLEWWYIVTGTASLPFFYLLAMALEKTVVTSKALTLISKDCYWIYLLQMFVIWGFTLITLESEMSFTTIFVLATLLAIGLPVLLAEMTRRVVKGEG